MRGCVKVPIRSLIELCYLSEHKYLGSVQGDEPFDHKIEPSQNPWLSYPQISVFVLFLWLSVATVLQRHAGAM